MLHENAGRGGPHFVVWMGAGSGRCYFAGGVGAAGSAPSFLSSPLRRRRRMWEAVCHSARVAG